MISTVFTTIQHKRCALESRRKRVSHMNAITNFLNSESVEQAISTALFYSFLAVLTLRPFFEILLTLLPSIPLFRPGLGLHSLLVIFCIVLSWLLFLVNPRKEFRTLYRLAFGFTIVSLYGLFHNWEPEIISVWLRLHILVILVPSLARALKNKAEILIYGAVLSWVFALSALLVDTAVSGGYFCLEHNILEMGGTCFTSFHHPTSFFLFLPYLFLAIDLNKGRGARFWILCALSFLLSIVTALTFVRLSWLGFSALNAAFLILMSIHRYSSRTLKGVALVNLALLFATLSYFRGNVKERFVDTKVAMQILKTELPKSPAQVKSVKGPSSKGDSQPSSSGSKKSSLVAQIHLLTKTTFWQSFGSGRGGIVFDHIRVWREQASMMERLLGVGINRNAARIKSWYKPHSDLVMLVVQTGILGFLLFVALWWNFWRGCDAPSVFDDKFRAAPLIGKAVILSLLSMAFVSGPEPSVPRGLYSVGFISLVLSLRRKPS